MCDESLLALTVKTTVSCVVIINRMQCFVLTGGTSEETCRESCEGSSCRGDCHV